MSEEKQTTAQFNPLAILPIALGALVVGALFMPWISFFATVSGLDLIRVGGEMEIQNTWMIAIPAVIGVCTIIISATRSEPLLYGIPALGVLVAVVYKLLSIGKEMGAKLSDVGDIIELFTELFKIGVLSTVGGLLALFIVSFACRKALKKPST